MSRISSFSEWLLRQAVVWGGLAYLAFYAFVVRTAAPGSTIARYFNGHWVEQATAAMFCVGVAALAIKLLGLAVQYAAVDRAEIGPAPEAGQRVADADLLLAELNSRPQAVRESYLSRRLRDALLFIQQRGSADSLETHLRHLEDVDLGRMHHSYATVRIIVATIPIMGFLGTVIGITMAIAKLSASSMEKSLEEVIQGLSVAFDTTALALSLSIVLLFAKFLVERIEVRLLGLVDRRASQQLLGRFRQYGTERDPHLASVKRISEQLLESVEGAATRQNELLSSSLAKANDKWASVAEDMAETVNQSLASALALGLKSHAGALNEGVGRFASQLEDTLIRHAEILNEGLDQHSDAMNSGIQSHSEALAQSLDRHVEATISAEERLATENRQHLSDVEGALGEAVLIAADRQEKLISQSESLLREMQSAIVEAAGTSVAQQEQLVRQSDVMLQVVEAVGQIRTLEDALNSNLRALASSHHFEEAIVGLSATLQLVTAKLGQNGPLSSTVALNQNSENSDGPSSRAA